MGSQDISLTELRDMLRDGGERHRSPQKAVQLSSQKNEPDYMMPRGIDNNMVSILLRFRSPGRTVFLFFGLVGARII